MALLHALGFLDRLFRDESAATVIDDFQDARGWREGGYWLEQNDDVDFAPPVIVGGIEFGRLSDTSRISQAAFDLIVFCEVTSEELYEARYRKPIWPGEQSGVTVGIGYDVGYVKRDRLWNDWSGVIPDRMITALEAAIGVKGAPAKQIARALRNKVDVPFAAAINVHASKVLPRWFDVVDNHLDNTRLLSPDSFGALVSLTYNRGASYSKAGERYAEMRAIKAHMANRRFDRIPAELRAMKRLWPNSAGLRKRREAEAILFENGLAASLVTAVRDTPSVIILKVDATSLNLRKVPSSSQGNATIIEVLSRGKLLTMQSTAPNVVDWVKVTADSGKIGFVKRMLTFQSNPGTPVEIPPNVINAYNRSIFADSRTFDSVTYKLGAKDPRTGKVDCSGWIHFINRRAFSAANNEAGVELFTSGMSGLLNTHSDHQVAMPGYLEMQLFSKEHAKDVLKRPGLLIGINFSDYEWERGQHRVFEIDHIVQTVLDPQGNMMITQSSSGGGGVNMQDFGTWFATPKITKLVNNNRLHIFDVFSMANLDALRMRFAPGAPIVDPLDLDIPEQDTSETPAS